MDADKENAVLLEYRYCVVRQSLKLNSVNKVSFLINFGIVGEIGYIHCVYPIIKNRTLLGLMVN